MDLSGFRCRHVQYSAYRVDGYESRSQPAGLVRSRGVVGTREYGHAPSLGYNHRDTTVVSMGNGEAHAS